MNLDYLNHLIPKRWTLLFYYWLPFFLTPSDFYFQSRVFIDQLIKHSISEDFPLEKLPDLMLILVKYASTTSEKAIAQKIIAEIYTRKTKKVRLRFLASILEKFSPEDKNIAIINEILQRIPDKFYNDYFKPLFIGKDFSPLDLKWCAYFKDKFSLKDRLNLCLSLPDDKLVANQTTLSKLAIEECEERFMQNFDLSLLNDNTIKRLLNIIFTRSTSSLFSKCILRSFVKKLFEKARKSKNLQASIIDSIIRPLDVFARYNFFKEYLAQLHNQENIEYFLSLCPVEQWPTMVDHVIVSVFNATDTEIETNPNLLLLAPLQKQTINLPINLFQFLAIQYLTKQPFDINVFKKAFQETQGPLNHHLTFSTTLQFVVAERHISAIKVFIKNHIMVHVPKESKRQDLHYIFNQFCSNDNYDKFLNSIMLIPEKLAEDLRQSVKADLIFLKQLLSQLYSILENPLVTQYKNELMMEQIKSQRDHEEKAEASRELLLNIHEGRQSRIAYQRMEELFGDQAPIMQEKWKKIGVHFFDAYDEEELKLAKKEAEEMKRLNRECNDLYSLTATSSCLGTSPSLTSYF